MGYLNRLHLPLVLTLNTGSCIRFQHESTLSTVDRLRKLREERRSGSSSEKESRAADKMQEITQLAIDGMKGRLQANKAILEDVNSSKDTLTADGINTFLIDHIAEQNTFFTKTVKEIRDVKKSIPTKRQAEVHDTPTKKPKPTDNVFDDDEDFEMPDFSDNHGSRGSPGKRNRAVPSRGGLAGANSLRLGKDRRPIHDVPKQRVSTINEQ